jgi:copper transport protein
MRHLSINTLALVGLLLAVLIFAFQPGRTVQAHANLVSSIPQAGAVLLQAPQEITLEFSENLDASFTNIELYDINNQVVVNGPGEIDPSKPTVWHLSLPAIPDGTYSANWKARSAVDGHVTFGTVGFSVGKASPPASLLPPPGTPDPATALPLPLDMLTRWLAYLSACVLAGGLFFAFLVWRPLQEGIEAEPKRWAMRTFQPLITTGGLGLIGATLGLLCVQAIQASHPNLGQALLEILVGQNGLLMSLRIGLVVLILILARKLPFSAQGHGGAWLSALAAGGLILLTFSLQGHGAALGSPIAVGLDWIHILTTAIWIGGLLPLALLIAHFRGSASQAILPALVSRFSRLALICVVLLGLSGLYSAVLHVGTLRALTATTYGRGLMVKTAVFGLLMILAAMNRQIFVPGLKKILAPSILWLNRTVRAELILGSMVLLAVGVISGSAPALEALKAQQRQGFLGSVQQNQAGLVLRIAPGTVGDDEFGVDIHDQRPGAAAVTPQVLLRFTMLDHDMGTTQAQATPNSQGRFTVRGSYLSMVGSWRVEVILRRQGFNDIRGDFQLAVKESANVTPEPTNPVATDAASITAGQALYQENCEPCHGPQGKGDGPAGLALNPHPADLSVHAAPGLHSDYKLYDWITNGYPGSAMPAFGKLLDDEQRWQLVNFLRTLAH